MQGLCAQVPRLPPVLGAGPAAAPEEGSCPFGHGKPAASSADGPAAEVPPAAAAAAAAEAAGGKCPFGHGGGELERAASDAALGDSIDGVPAFGAGAGDAGQPAPAVCPFGFGGGSLGPRMTELHCVLCR
jgi:hypothetical protein